MDNKGRDFVPHDMGSDNVNADRNKSQKISLTFVPADSGLIFSLSVIMMVVVSIAFSGAISLIARSKGFPVEEYLESIKNSFAYNLAAYLSSSVSLILAMLLFARYRKIKPFTGAGFTMPQGRGKARAKYFILAAMLSFGLIFSFTELNNLFISFLRSLGYAKEDMSIPNDELWQYLIWLVAAAVLPAFTEEFLFRGYIKRGFEGQSTVFSVLVGGALFCVFHQNPQQTPYQFLCGVVFALIAVKSGSLLPSILMHFLNNAVVLTFDYFSIGAMPKAVYILLVVLGGISFVAAMVYLIFFDKKKDDEKVVAQVKRNVVEKQSLKPFCLTAFIGVFVCVIVWVTDLITNIG